MFLNHISVHTQRKKLEIFLGDLVRLSCSEVAGIRIPYLYRKAGPYYVNQLQRISISCDQMLSKELLSTGWLGAYEEETGCGVDILTHCSLSVRPSLVVVGKELDGE